MSNHLLTDHEGRPIPANEPDDAIIHVWEFSPHPNSEYDSCAERSWQRMLSLINDNLDIMLERYELSELMEEDFILKIRLRTMTKNDYQLLIENPDF